MSDIFCLGFSFEELFHFHSNKFKVDYSKVRSLEFYREEIKKEYRNLKDNFKSNNDVYKIHYLCQLYLVVKEQMENAIVEVESMETYTTHRQTDTYKPNNKKVDGLIESGDKKYILSFRTCRRILQARKNMNNNIENILGQKFYAEINGFLFRHIELLPIKDLKEIPNIPGLENWYETITI